MISRLRMKIAAMAVAASPYACMLGGQGAEPTYALAAELPAHVREANGAEGIATAARPWPATTGSLTAQLWIELGLARFLASDPDGAAAAFRTAQRHDASCPICFWGEALAGSPGPEAPAVPGEQAALDAALALEQRATAKEAALIAALDVRFRGAPWEMEQASQRGRDHDYAQAMRAVAARFPSDRVVADLAAAARVQAAAWR
jgi:hypothetical protein